MYYVSFKLSPYCNTHTCNPKIINLHFQAKKHPKMAAEPNNKMADPSRKEESELRKSVLVTLSFIHEESNPFFKF